MGVELHIIEAKGIKCFPEVVQVANFPHAFHKYVIYVHLHVSPNLLGKYLIYKPLVCCPCILQPKWHDFVAEKSLAHDK